MGDSSSPGSAASAEYLETFQSQLEDDTGIVAVAAVRALTAVLRLSQASTIMGINRELEEAQKVLIGVRQKLLQSGGGARTRTPIPLECACELFRRYVTRTSLEIPDMEQCKTILIERGEQFAQKALQSRHTISVLGQQFIRDGMKVFTIGKSRTVLDVLCEVQRRNRRFEVIVPETRPDELGYQMAEELVALNIPVKIIHDFAVASIMEDVDLVLVGAEGVLENGGIINLVGTYSTALVAQAMKKPFYVAAESYKFSRKWPLSQQEAAYPSRDAEKFRPLRDVRPASLGRYNSCSDLTEAAQCTPGTDDLSGPECIVYDENPSYFLPHCDMTPPDLITLLFTDLGVLTPSAVSDELIKIYPVANCVLLQDGRRGADAVCCGRAPVLLSAALRRRASARFEPPCFLLTLVFFVVHAPGVAIAPSCSIRRSLSSSVSRFSELFASCAGHVAVTASRGRRVVLFDAGESSPDLESLYALLLSGELTLERREQLAEARTQRAKLGVLALDLDMDSEFSRNGPRSRSAAVWSSVHFWPVVGTAAGNTVRLVCTTTDGLLVGSTWDLKGQRWGELTKIELEIPETTLAYDGVCSESGAACVLVRSSSDQTDGKAAHAAYACESADTGADSARHVTAELRPARRSGLPLILSSVVVPSDRKRYFSCVLAPTNFPLELLSSICKDKDKVVSVVAALPARALVAVTAGHCITTVDMLSSKTDRTRGARGADAGVAESLAATEATTSSAHAEALLHPERESAGGSESESAQHRAPDGENTLASTREESVEAALLWRFIARRIPVATLRYVLPVGRIACAPGVPVWPLVLPPGLEVASASAWRCAQWRAARAAPDQTGSAHASTCSGNCLNVPVCAQRDTLQGFLDVITVDDLGLQWLLMVHQTPEDPTPQVTVLPHGATCPDSCSRASTPNPPQCPLVPLPPLCLQFSDVETGVMRALDREQEVIARVAKMPPVDLSLAWLRSGVCSVRAVRSEDGAHAPVLDCDALLAAGISQGAPSGCAARVQLRRLRCFTETGSSRRDDVCSQENAVHEQS